MVDITNLGSKPQQHQNWCLRTNSKSERWSSSPKGIENVIAAPAENYPVESSGLKEGKVEYNIGNGAGTSFSAPFVAAAAALWLQKNGGRSTIVKKIGGFSVSDSFEWEIRKTANVPSYWNPYEWGEGILNAEKLIFESKSPQKRDKILLTIPTINDLAGRVDTPRFKKKLYPNRPYCSFLQNIRRIDKNLIAEAFELERKSGRDPRMRHRLTDLTIEGIISNLKEQAKDC